MKLMETNNTKTIGFASLEDKDIKDSITGVYSLEDVTLILKVLKLLYDVGFDTVKIRMKQDYPLMLHIGEKSVFAVAPRIDDE